MTQIILRYSNFYPMAGGSAPKKSLWFSWTSTVSTGGQISSQAFKQNQILTCTCKKKYVYLRKNNDLIVFNVMTVRSLIDSFIYDDFYNIIDKNMSDSNGGGQKEINIIDNWFIVNGVLKNKKSKR